MRTISPREHSNSAAPHLPMGRIVLIKRGSGVFSLEDTP